MQSLISPDKPGFPCPECGARIEVALQLLLSTQAARCGECGLELTVDKDHSAGALRELENLNQKLERAK